MAMEKKDKELFKRFIDVILDIDNINEDNIDQKLAEVEQLNKDCEERKAELEAREKARKHPVPTINHHCGRMPKLFTTPVKAEGMRRWPTEETYCAEQLIAEFMMSRCHEKDFLFHIDIGTYTYLSFNWDEDFQLHITYTDEKERRSGGCTLINPDADDIANMVLDMIWEDDERETI